MEDQPKAKIFISCGQSTDQERQISEDLKKRLESEEFGFEAYVATQQQTLKGLKENIFQELSSSEYFLFIDFKREKLTDSEFCRGSLFSHQELAIASFRDTPVLAFREKGVKPDDGIMKFIQANAKEFTNRPSLIELILDEIKKSGWKSDWKNQLVLDVNQQERHSTVSTRYFPYLFPGVSFFDIRFFHIKVENLNPYSHAKNCYVFLEKIENEDEQNIIPMSFELKWRAFDLPNATILPKSSRIFDAFFVEEQDGSRIKLHHFWHSIDQRNIDIYYDSINDYEECFLTYLIVSDNFKPARATFRLNLSDNIDQIVFEKIEPNSK